MRIITFRTPYEKSVGLQHKPFVEDETLFVFPEVGHGDIFHSKNVPEPFDIAFVEECGRVIFVTRMYPEDDLIEAPEGTALALEAKAGRMAKWGVVSGSVVSVAP